MPAKVTQSQTDNSQGLISVEDAHRVISDFQNEVDLKSQDESRNPVSKRYYFDISLDKIHQVISMSNGALPSKFRMHFVMTLPDQMDCDNNYSIKNTLSILISAVDASDNALIQPEDFILLEGSKDHGAIRSECCVQGTPSGETA